MPGAVDRLLHPITGSGEEMDGVLALDNVFVPNHRILSSQVKELHDPNLFNSFARHEHWHTLIRIVVRAEMDAAIGHRPDRGRRIAGIRDQSRLDAQNASATGTPASTRQLAEEPVTSEPLSRGRSLLISENTRNFREFR